MANKRITDMPEEFSPSDDDILYIVDATPTIPVSKKIKVGTFKTALSETPHRVEKITLTNTEITNKEITLQHTPTNNQSIRVFVESVGLKVSVGTDYSYSGSTIYWNGYELQNKLEEGDILSIFYY